ncbi:MAG: TonB-dependent receptor [Gammaproteobacteria bacterium]|nr:TonB-dependent receptor [Gammaproteobacteria bacterium]
MKIQFPLLLALLTITPVIGSAALGPIIVTPSIVEEQREESATPITVIDAKMIARSGANNLAELLRGQAGVHISDLFGDGSQATVDLRGFGPTASSNTLILIDGRRLNNSADQAAPDLSTIDLEDIQQIEILQGSGGVLYGNQAVGGVINIITKKVTQDKVTVGLKLGSYDSSRISASINKLVGNTQLAVTAFASSSDNYRDHNKADVKHFSLRANHQYQSFIGYLELATSDDHILTPGALLQSELDASRTQSLSIYSNDFFDTQTNTFRVGMDKKIDERQSLNIDYSKRIDDREFIQTFRPTPAVFLSTQDRDTQTLSGKYILKPENYAGSSIVFGFNLEETDYRLLSVIGPQEMDQAISDIYVSSNWNIGAQRVMTAGVRYSDQQAEIAGENFDDSVSVVSLGFTQRVGDWKLSARADQNFRYPTVEEHTNVPFGDPLGLKTQEGVSIELGAEIFTNNNRYRATLYSIDLDNEIAFDSSGFSNLNLDATSRQGLILEASNQWSDRTSTNLSYTLMDAEITDGAFNGNTLPLVPEKTFRLDGLYQINQNMRVSLEFIAVDEQVFGGDFANALGKLDGYNVLNGNLSYSVNRWDLAFRINNLLDEEYSEIGSQFTDFSAFPVITIFESFFPSPERNFWISAKYEF